MCYFSEGMLLLNIQFCDELQTDFQVFFRFQYSYYSNNYVFYNFIIRNDLLIYRNIALKFIKLFKYSIAYFDNISKCICTFLLINYWPFP